MSFSNAKFTECLDVDNYRDYYLDHLSMGICLGGSIATI